MAIHMAGSPEDYSATDPAQQQQDAEVCRAVDEQRRRADLALLRLIHALAHAYNGGVYANSGVDVAANPSMISQRQAQAALSVARDFLRSDTPMTASQAHHSWRLASRSGPVGRSSARHLHRLRGPVARRPAWRTSGT